MRVRVASIGFALAAVVVTAALQPSAPTAAIGVPSAPRSVAADAASGSVKVSWREPQSVGTARVDRYKVVRSATALPARAYGVAAKKRSITIAELVPGTTYSFKVLAHSKRGWGKASKTVKAVPLPFGADGGFGVIAGPCRILAPELGQPTASLFTNSFDFGDDPYDDGDLTLLTLGAQAVFTSNNAGGSSALAETFAFETLARCERASLLKTENEIAYTQPGKTTDLLVEISGSKVGVRVVRAMSGPTDPDNYTAEQADAQLTTTLAGVNESSQNVAPADAWIKQILVVLAYADTHAETLAAAWGELDDATRANTIVYVVVTNGSDTPVYYSS